MAFYSRSFTAYRSQLERKGMRLSPYGIFSGESLRVVCILACRTTDQHKGACSYTRDNGASKEDHI